MAALTLVLGAESESERKQSDALSAKVNSLHTPPIENKTKQSDALPPSFDPLDTRGSHWTLENHLKVYLQRTTESSIASVKPSVLWQDVSVTGSGVIATYQETVTGTFTGPGQAIAHLFTRTKKPNSNKTIIHGFEGLVKNGEMLLVLGRPGSGCTTLLKALAGLTDEYTGWQGSIEYNGVPIDDMRKRFRGEVVYSPEVDNHLPHLTVAQTLDFAAETRVPHTRIAGASRSDYAHNTRDLLATTFGLTAVLQTIVGDAFIRGVSGGERKRVSISEMLATRASVGLWDTPTRGLDASTSLEYAQALRVATSTLRTIAIASLFQASDNIVNVFDNVTVLYAGRQVFFGSIPDALEHFHQLGFFHSTRQTTADFLTAVTDPNARVVRDGFEETAPRSADQFAKRWQESVYYRKLQAEISEHKALFPSNNPAGKEGFATVLKLSQAPGLRSGSKYILNIAMQMLLLMKRAYQRTWGNKAVLIAGAGSSMIMALIGGSAWYNSAPSTAGFFSKGSVMFFSLLINTINAMGEIPLLYAQRPIVERQKTYAMYHPGLESLANMTAEYPIKFLNLVVLNIVLYFMTNLKREAGAFFVFFLITYVSYIIMSSVFRTVGAATKTVEEAMGLAGVLVLALVIYCGYIIPIPTMHPWFKWLSYINPLRYAFEALMANEFHGLEASCTDLVPSGKGFEDVQFANQVCAITGSTPGSSFVSGDAYIKASFTYTHSHLWRNFGILIAFWAFFSFTYAVATELQKHAGSRGEFLIFKKGQAPASIQNALEGTHTEDLESGSEGAQNLTEELDGLRVHSTRIGLAGLVQSKDIFTWQNVCYDVTVHGGTQRRLLNNVHGYVKPGTLTALMGESGAGKTTLLNVLAQRVDTGTVTGDMLVNGSPLDVSFQRRSGYVQQQDVHLAEATVREALRFSAFLRQPKETPLAEKYEYVERVISMLEMEDYAEAVIGHPGSGLSVEQRKRTTIGVELVAKPALLLFLDEPTSGLDSQSAWSIVKFVRKLADSGQAILCTIHQPSSLLFQQFDRVLLLSKGGQTVYFGDIGENSKTITEYFEAHGAKACAANANPAEYILDVIGTGATARVEEDWHGIWNSSQESQKLTEEIHHLKGRMQSHHALPPDLDTQHPADADHSSNHVSEKFQPTRFAVSWISQYKMVQVRIFQQYWRSPVYIVGKAILNIFAGLFLGFTFYKESNSIAGLQNKLFAVFMSILLCFPLMAQLQPTFVSLRRIYEVREKPSKMYHWSTFVLSNVVVEVFYNCIGSTLFFLPWYFAVGFNEHVDDASNRAGYTWIMLMLFAMYYTTFAQAMAAISPDETTAGILTALLGTLMTLFNGVLQPVSQLPHFWKFMYRVSPFSYLIGGILSTGLHDIKVICRPEEINIFQPPSGQTCNDYAGSFLNNSPGKIINPKGTSDCQYCRYATGDQFLAGLELSWDQRWRNTGLMFAYISFNLFLLFSLFYISRELKTKGATKMTGGRAISDRADTPPTEKKE